MGVTGLQTFLRKYCSESEACSKVHLPTIFSAYCYHNAREEAEIVVDAQSCYSMWYKDLDWTIGFEVQELINRLENFVDTFNNMEAKLVFFFGGVTPENKRETWRKRRIDRMRKNVCIFDKYYHSGKPFNEIPFKLDSIPPNMGNFVAFVLKHVLNCTVYMTVGEADQGIIKYAHENDVFAIFAHDTDFVISHIKAVVLCAESFDDEKLTTLLYDRRKLCQQLDIKEKRLPLLAILAGNDFISHKELKPFQRRICNKPANEPHIFYNILMPAIGDYIRNLPSYDDDDDSSDSYDYDDDDDDDDECCDKLMENVCWDVFGSCSRMYEMKSVFQSYFAVDEDDSESTAYIPNVSDRIWHRVLNAARNRLENVLLPVTAWSILSKQVYESSVCFEDFQKFNDNKKPAFQASATVTRSLRQRLYGLLLYEKRYSNPSVTEWCAENSESYQEPVTVKPHYLRVNHPGLRALWDPKRADRHLGRKWNLFLKVVSPRMKNIKRWFELRSDMVIPTAACYYLYEKSFLSMSELEAVLVTLVTYPLYNRDDLDSIAVGVPNLKACQISMTYSRTYSLIFSLMASCGFPSPLNEDTCYTKFEGKLFQKMYREVTINEVCIEELCQYNEPYEDLFFEMKNIIIYK